MEFFYKINPLLILSYIFLGAMLYAAIYIINNYIVPLLDNHKERIIRWWGKVQMILWISFFALFSYRCLQDNLYISLIFAILIFGLGWNYWRNIFSGILIRFNNQFKVGDFISTDFASGELKTINLAQSELLNEVGELVIIPNFKLRNSVLKHLAKKSNVKMYTFNVKAENNSLELLRLKAINCPYVSANHSINIESNTEGRYAVKLALVDAVFVDRVKKWLE